jgi:hypothetical protein
MPSTARAKFIREAIPGVQIWEDDSGGLPFVVMEPGVSAYFPLSPDNYIEARMDERKFLEVRGGGIDSPSLFTQGTACNAMMVHAVNTAQSVVWEPLTTTMRRIKAGWDQLRDKHGEFRKPTRTGGR